MQPNRPKLFGDCEPSMADASLTSFEARLLVQPSPEEQRRLDENRKRRDAQSQRMSELLLKGWKMLGTFAFLCVMLRRRIGV